MRPSLFVRLSPLVLFFLLAGCKVYLGFEKLPWLWVFSPLWLPVAVGLCVLLLAGRRSGNGRR